jgi:hypothetical protein
MSIYRCEKCETYKDNDIEILHDSICESCYLEKKDKGVTDNEKSK